MPCKAAGSARSSSPTATAASSVTQHGRQDASLSGCDEAQGILGADRQHGVRRVRRAIVGRRADGQDQPPTAPERRCACRRGQRMRRRRRCRPRAAGQPTARDRRRSFKARIPAGNASCAQSAVGLPGGLAQQMCRQDDLARIDIADSTAPSNACAASGSGWHRAPSRGNLPSLQVRSSSRVPAARSSAATSRSTTGALAATGSGSPCPTCSRTAQAVARAAASASP